MRKQWIHKAISLDNKWMSGIKFSHRFFQIVHAYNLLWTIKWMEKCKREFYGWKDIFWRNLEYCQQTLKNILVAWIMYKNLLTVFYKTRRKNDWKYVDFCCKKLFWRQHGRMEEKRKQQKCMGLLYKLFYIPRRFAFP